MLLALVLSFAAEAQVRGKAPPAAPPAQEQPPDPLGRNTPRGTIVQFMRAAERDDTTAALRYFQTTSGQRRNAEALVNDLKELVERSFSQAINSISDAPDGNLTDGLPVDREAVGPLAIANTKAEIVLVRVKDPQAGRIWLISSETLARVPELRRLAAPTWVEGVMPDALSDNEAFGISWGQWIALVASLVLPVLLLALLSRVGARLAAALLRHPSHRLALEAWERAVRWPAISAIALAIHLGATATLGLPVTFRYAHGRVNMALLVIAVAWLARRVMALAFARARTIAWGKNRASTQSLMLLGERVLKVTVALVAVFAVLAIAGLDMKTALAGVGIGGVALALGAQKTVENFLGGVFLLSDKALAVGDLCSISNRVGRVEDITLRSIRLRTADQSLLSIPAGVLAQAGIENFATREKILLQRILRLRHGTGVGQLQRILEGTRALLQEEARLEPGGRIRLVDFGAQAIELELFAYVQSADDAEFQTVREELLLKIAALIESVGSGFAQPAQWVAIDGAPRDEAHARPVPPREAAALKEVRLAEAPQARR
ncbi:hypothetical protein GCM10028796_42090 [Ramlibacter monticola]